MTDEALYYLRGYLKNSGTVVLLSDVRALLARLDRSEVERNALAVGIGEAAIKAGIILANTSLTGPQLLMLCDNLADAALAAQSKGKPNE
jgi:hypothetical protein